ncbi:MAG: hypothetical protein HQM06_15975 [Magnetococcales bacterium]|nr:hypothetical protein [Magnetococcales bacterium]
MASRESHPSVGFEPNKNDICLGIQKMTEVYSILAELLEETIPTFKWRGGPRGLYSLSPTILQDIAIRIERDKERFRHFHGSQNPAGEKVGGFFVYWIAKRRPIVFTDAHFSSIGHELTMEEYYLNEYFAIYAGLNREISERMQIKSVDELRSSFDARRLCDIIWDWRYSLAFRNFSSDDMALLIRLCLS